MREKTEKFLWEHYYKENERRIEVPDLSIYDYMMEQTKGLDKEYALNYFGKKITYKVFWEYIDRCAKSLKVLGIKEKDVITICMPNTPEAVIAIFAIFFAMY